MLALTLVFITQIIRVAESTTTAVRNLDYEDAARATGAGTLAILRAHVLPNVLGPIFVSATSLISVSVILASGCPSWASARVHRSHDGTSAGICGDYSAAPVTLLVDMALPVIGPIRMAAGHRSSDSFSPPRRSAA